MFGVLICWADALQSFAHGKSADNAQEEIMSDHPSTVEGALKWAEVCAKCFEDEPPDMTSVALQTLAAEVRRLRTPNTEGQTRGGSRVV